MCGGSKTTRHFATHDQRKSHQRIDDAAVHANHRERAATLESWPVRTPAPPAVRRPIERFLDKVKLKIRGAAFRLRS